MAFTFVACSYILALVIDIFLIFVTMINVITFDELKTTDYKNPIEQCRNLNNLVLPEYGSHFFSNLLFACTGQWSTVIFNSPLMAYHVNRYWTRPIMSTAGIYDVTTIMNAQILSHCKHEGWSKLVFYLLLFFYYLYALIFALISK